MIQKHKILLNPSFSANSEDTSIISASTLSVVGEYYITNVQGIGGGIVNPSNVRGFLNDEFNEFIVNDFFSYLTGSTNTIEFAEIYNSDQKLSDVFNGYYESSILNNQIPSTSIIDQTLTGTTGITIIENGIHNFDGISPSKDLNYTPLSIDNSTRKLRVYSALTTFTEEDSYYIPVFISGNIKQMAGLQYEVCDEIVSLILNQPQTGSTNPGPIDSVPEITPTPPEIITPEITPTPPEIIIPELDPINIITIGGFSITSN